MEFSQKILSHDNLYSCEPHPVLYILFILFFYVGIIWHAESFYNWDTKSVGMDFAVPPHLSVNPHFLIPSKTAVTANLLENTMSKEA